MVEVGHDRRRVQRPRTRPTSTRERIQIAGGPQRPFTAGVGSRAACAMVEVGHYRRRAQGAEPDLLNQGLRLVALEVDGGKLAAVWRPGSGAQWWKSGMTVDEFKAQDQTYFNQGLPSTTMDIDNGKFGPCAARPAARNGGSRG